MKEILLKIIILLITINLFLFISCVYAVSSCELEFTGDKTEIKPEDKIIYELKVKNINAENGIALMSTTLKYDKDIFEYSIITENSNWSYVSNEINSDNITFTYKNLESTKEDQTIAEIIFTAKQEINTGKQEIALTDITLSTGDVSPQTIKIDDIKSEIMISTNDEKNTDNNEEEQYDSSTEENQEVSNEEQQDTINEENKENEENNQPENETTTNENIEIYSKDATLATANSLPYTGVLRVIEFLMILLAIISAVIFYRKFIKWKNI